VRPPAGGSKFGSEITVNTGTKETQPAGGVDLIGMAKSTVAKHKVLGFAKKDLDARRASAMLP